MWRIIKYIQKKWKQGFLCVFIILSYNLYYVNMMQDKHIRYLLYLDFLVLVLLLFYTGIRYIEFVRWEDTKERLLQRSDIIYRELPDYENQSITEHDVRILEEELKRQFDERCELQDCVAKWCHEWKIPLASCLLINENMKDAAVRAALRGPLEQMNQQINMLLRECSLQSPLMDLQIKSVSLAACIRASVKNNQFFLIQKKFSIDISKDIISSDMILDELVVYTDFTWLVYILDQLLSNAVKYAVKENPTLRFWIEKHEDEIMLFVEDNGEGIQDSDIRRIFEKGYTGSNCHNGKYKSTGMGLYLAAKTAEKLGHEITVESEYGVYTRFCIILKTQKAL